MELTLAIITKNRPKTLEKCLQSVFNQSLKEFTVLIVDNDPLKSAEPVFKDLQAIGGIWTEYVCEPSAGYAYARNCAVKHCKTRYIGFIDDDCILSRNWAEYGLAAIQKHQSAFVEGLSKNIEASDIYSKVEVFITRMWWCDSYNKDTFELKENRLDTKNVILDRTLLVENNIYFDERFNRFGSEDTDLGIQLKQKNLIGYYVGEMILVHEEISSFERFRRKAFCYGYNCYNIYSKWNFIQEYDMWKYCYTYRFRRCWLIFFKLKQGSLKANLRFFYLIKLFNHLYLKGYYQCKRDVRNRQRASRVNGGKASEILHNNE